MAFDFHVHGLWIIGAFVLFAGVMLAGNLEWIEGTTAFSYTLTAVIALVLILLAGMFWISSAVNARQEFR